MFTCLTIRNLKSIAITVFSVLALLAGDCSSAWPGDRKPALSNCENALAPTAGLSTAQLQNRLSKRFRLISRTTILGTLINSLINLVTPLTVHEQENLLINGSLPPTGAATNLAIVRKSREDGIKEIRRATGLNEERSLYKPSLKFSKWNRKSSYS